MTWGLLPGCWVYSRNSAYLACLNGQIPHLKIGKRILIPKASLARLLERAGNGTRENESD